MGMITKEVNTLEALVKRNSKKDWEVTEASHAGYFDGALQINYQDVERTEEVECSGQYKKGSIILTMKNGDFVTIERRTI